MRLAGPLSRPITGGTHAGIRAPLLQLPAPGVRQTPEPPGSARMATVPEGDTIFRAAVRLREALVGKRVADFELRRDPGGRRGPERGVEITGVDAAGKHLLMHFADGYGLGTPTCR